MPRGHGLLPLQGAGPRDTCTRASGPLSPASGPASRPAHRESPASFPLHGGRALRRPRPVGCAVATWSGAVASPRSGRPPLSNPAAPQDDCGHASGLRPHLLPRPGVGAPGAGRGWCHESTSATRARGGHVDRPAGGDEPPPGRSTGRAAAAASPPPTPHLRPPGPGLRVGPRPRGGITRGYRPGRGETRPAGGPLSPRTAGWTRGRGETRLPAGPLSPRSTG